MIDFVLRGSTDLIYGKDKESRVGDLIRDFGGTKVLIHHSGEPFVLPLIQRVKVYLEQAGLAWAELGGVVPNPRIELVYQGIELCRREQVNFILAVGGGSVIDSAKAIGLGTVYDGDVWDIYDGKVKQQGIVPVGVISTFAGTGSEATFGSVITKGKLKRGIEDPDDHVMIRPKFVIMNPELTFTVPRFQTAVGIADMEEPENYEARGALMVLSPLAINGVTKVGRWGDWGCHDIEHEMSGEWDIPHGAGLAVVMPAWMRYVYRDYLNLFVKFAGMVFHIPADMECPERTALAGIERFSSFLFQTLGLPASLSGLGIQPEALTDEVLRRVAGQVFYQGGETAGRTRPLRVDDVYRILKLCV